MMDGDEKQCSTWTVTSMRDVSVCLFVCIRCGSSQLEISMYLGIQVNSNSDRWFSCTTRSPSPLAMELSYNGLSFHDSATSSSDGISPFSSNSLGGNVCTSFFSLKSFSFVFREVHLTLGYQLFMGLKNYVLAPDVLLCLDSLNQRSSKMKFIIWGPSMQSWK